MNLWEKQPYTDLAVEAREMLTKRVDSDLSGITVEKSGDEDVLITRVLITNEQAAERMGKERGCYVTIEAQGLRYKDTMLQNKVMGKLANELAVLAKLDHKATVLIVGLGNWNVTPDALGPKAVEKVVVTRHLHELLSPELRTEINGVCAIAPGVLGVTGIETAEIVQGVVAKIKPDLVIVVDALAAAASTRIVTTIQLANTGIRPGSGLGNKRFAITQESLGVPVIAIGVPTVIHASTIVMDTIDSMQEQAAFARYFKSLSDLNNSDRSVIVRQILPETLNDLMVTPKEVDTLISDMANIVAGGINQALHPTIDYNNIHQYLH